MHRRAFVLVAALALLAAACGDSDESGGATTTTTTSDQAQPTVDDEPAQDQRERSQSALEGAECPVDALDGADDTVQITMWHSMAAVLGETLTGLVEDYNSSQDRVEVTLVNQNSYGETFDAYRIASADDRPNVVQLEETARQSMIDSGTALPVEACAIAAGYDFEDYIDRVVDAFTVGGVLWPMPFNISNPVLWYDAGAFREAGLDPDDPPQTLEEVRAAAEALVESGAATGGMAFDLAPGSMGWMIEQIAAKAGVPYVNNGNGRDGLADAVLFNNDVTLTVIEFLRDLEADGLAVNTGRNPGGQENFLAFLSEDDPVAMTINTSAALSSVLAQLPILAPELELRIAFLPGVEVPDKGGAQVGGAALWLPADKHDEEIAAAWDFVRWLNEPEQQASWHLGSGYLPLRESSAELPEVMAAWEEQPAFRVPFDQLLAGVDNEASAGPVIGPHTLIREELVDGMERVLLQGADPVTVLDELEQTANELLADYARRTGR